MTLFGLIMFSGLALSAGAPKAAPAAKSTPLPALQAPPKGITVSGFADGAAMALQVQVALSARVSGVGSFAGVPYGCAQGDEKKAVACTTEPRQVKVDQLIEKAKALAAAGRIDPLTNLPAAKLFLWNGAKDKLVGKDAPRMIEIFYHAFAPNIDFHTEVDHKGGHGLPVDGKDLGACDGGKYELIYCGYDGIGRMMTYFNEAAKTRGKADPARLLGFDEKEFGLAATGQVYVPVACAPSAGACGVHVAFRGCGVTVEKKKKSLAEWAVATGYADWAEGAKTVVLFPQATSSKKNPRGCWDWYGVTNAKDHDAYLTKDAPEIHAVAAMLDRLASGLHP